MSPTWMRHRDKHRLTASQNEQLLTEDSLETSTRQKACDVAEELLRSSMWRSVKVQNSPVAKLIQHQMEKMSTEWRPHVSD